MGTEMRSSDRRPSRASAPALDRVAPWLARGLLALTVGAGSAFAAVMAGYGVPLGRAVSLAIPGADRGARPVVPTLLERLAGGGAGADVVLEGVGWVLVASALALAAALLLGRRAAPWTRAALGAWLAVGLTAAAATLLEYIPTEPGTAVPLILPWLAFLGLVAWGVARLAPAPPPPPHDGAPRPGRHAAPAA